MADSSAAVSLPSTVVYSCHSVNAEEDHTEAYLASVHHDGLVTWDVPLVLKSSCALDVTFFPWDHQSCPLRWSSWIMPRSKLDLLNASATGDSSEFILSGEWRLLGFPVQRSVKPDDLDPRGHAYLEFTVQLQRKALYYVTNVILPCAFITTSILLVFLLPPESAEKVSLAVTILLATTIFLTMVAEVMPAQSTVVPLIGEFCFPSS